MSNPNETWPSPPPNPPPIQSPRTSLALSGKIALYCFIANDAFIVLWEAARVQIALSFTIMTAGVLLIVMLALAGIGFGVVGWQSKQGKEGFWVFLFMILVFAVLWFGLRS